MVADLNAGDGVRDWIFTFGCGHHFAGAYVLIRGTFRSAREEMFRRFGAKWSMQYASPEEAGVVRWGLRELTPELEELVRKVRPAVEPEPEA